MPMGMDPPEPTGSIELRPAYAWTCDRCGRDNFTNVVIPELTTEEAAEVKRQLGEGFFYCAPEVVICSHCSESYAVIEFGDEDDGTYPTEPD